MNQPAFDYIRFDRLCRESGETGRALGLRFGVSDMTVLRWRRGEYVPDAASMLLIIEWSDVSFVEWMSGPSTNMLTDTEDSRTVSES